MVERERHSDSPVRTRVIWNLLLRRAGRWAIGKR
jgi:hypothetical protein